MKKYKGYEIKDYNVYIFLVVFMILFCIWRCTNPDYIRECRESDYQEFREDSIEDANDVKADMLKQQRKLKEEYAKREWIIDKKYQTTGGGNVVRIRKPNSDDYEEMFVGEFTYQKAVLGQKWSSVN